MPVRFYLHTPLNDTNENRALLTVAGLLYRRYGRKDAPTVHLIANIDPYSDSKMRGLTQLDALIMVENRSVGVVEFKNFPDEFDGRRNNAPWPVKGMMRHGKQVFVSGGSAVNPYQQAVTAHQRWAKWLGKESGKVFRASRHEQLDWRHLNGYVLFNPSLHKASLLPKVDNNHLWLNFRGVDDILAILFAADTQVRLSSAEMRTVSEQIFHARPWDTLQTLLQQYIGYLHVQTSDNKVVRQIPVPRHVDWLIGRSSSNQIVIEANFTRVSRVHLRLISQKKAVRIFRQKTTHGTFVDGEDLDDLGGSLLLVDGEKITLGGIDQPGVCSIKFYRDPAGLGGGDNDVTEIATL